MCVCSPTRRRSRSSCLTCCRDFSRTHRNVNVDLRERLSPSIVRAVTDGAADVGIVAGNVRIEGLEVLPYREDRLILVCARGHALGQA